MAFVLYFTFNSWWLHFRQQ